MKRFAYTTAIVVTIILTIAGVNWLLAQGFNAFQQTTFTSVTVGQTLVENTVIGFNQLSWTVSGTVSTCTVSLDSSPDGTTWTVNSIITGQTCTSNGNSVVTAGSANFMRVNMQAISGAGATIVVTYKGWVVNPSAGGLPSGLTFVAPTLTVSTSGSGNGQVALSGNTSGTATFTAPAIAGTTTNGVSMSNVLLGPNGAIGTPTYSFSAGTGSGLWFTGTVPVMSQAGSAFTAWRAANVTFPSNAVITFASTTDPTGAIDTGIIRGGPAIVAIGTSAGDTNGKLLTAGFQSGGTKFTTNAGCGESAGTITAGASAGRITTAGSTSCTTIITMGNSLTATTGWQCSATDITTLGDAANPHMTTSTTTTASIATGTIVAGDVISVACWAY